MVRAPSPVNQELDEENPYQNSDCDYNSQQGCRLGFRRIFLGAIGAVCIVGIMEVGAMQSHWQAASVVDRMSRHDQQLLGLQSAAANGLTISNMFVDIEHQDGISVNVDVPMSVVNQMDYSFIDNNQAVTKDGNVQRLNGAFAGNVIKHSGVDEGTESLEKKESGSLPSASDDASRRLGVGSTVEAAQEDVAGSTYSFLLEQQKIFTDNPAPMKFLNSLTPVFQYAQLSNGGPGSVDLRSLLGTGNSSTTETDVSYSKGARTLKDVPENSSVQRALADANDDSVSGTTAYQELLDALVLAGQNGPVSIDHMHVHIKKQRGIQTNLEAPIQVKNEMEHAFKGNNKAMSTKGSILRVNGVMVGSNMD